MSTKWWISVLWVNFICWLLSSTPNKNVWYLLQPLHVSWPWVPLTEGPILAVLPEQNPGFLPALDIIFLKCVVKTMHLRWLLHGLNLLCFISVRICLCSEWFFFAYIAAIPIPSASGINMASLAGDWAQSADKQESTLVSRVSRSESVLYALPSAAAFAISPSQYIPGERCHPHPIFLLPELQ